MAKDRRRRKVDEIRAARALRKLDEHARAHPEAFDPVRLPTTPTALAAAGQGRGPGAVTVEVSPVLLALTATVR
jgi:hypothetical protein